MVIRAAICGAFFDKEQNPNQPITLDEIKAAALDAVAAGACSVHFHVRDEQGRPTKNLEYFRHVIAHVQERVGDAVVYDGEAQMGATFEEAHSPVFAGLFDIAPVIPHVGNLGDTIRVTPIPTMRAQAESMIEHGVKPEIAVHDTCSLDNAYRYLIAPGILGRPLCWLILPALPGLFYMPNPTAMLEGLTLLVRRIREIDPESVITVCAAGRAGLYLATTAIMMGLHVRIGMEDVIYRFPNSHQLVQSNGELIRAAVDIAAHLGRRPATADEFRRIAGITHRRPELTVA